MSGENIGRINKSPRESHLLNPLKLLDTHKIAKYDLLISINNISECNGTTHRYQWMGTTDLWSTFGRGVRFIEESDLHNDYFFVETL